MNRKLAIGCLFGCTILIPAGIAAWIYFRNRPAPAATLETVPAPPSPAATGK